MLDFAKKMMFTRLDFSTFLICYYGYISGNKSEENVYVAICGGSCHHLAEIDWHNSMESHPKLKKISFQILP